MLSGLWCEENSTAQLYKTSKKRMRCMVNNPKTARRRGNFMYNFVRLGELIQLLVLLKLRADVIYLDQPK